MENEMIELMTPKERLEKIKEAIKSHRIAMNYTQKVSSKIRNTTSYL